MQDKAAELETQAQTNRILLEASKPAATSAPRKVKKKKKRSVRRPTVSTATKDKTVLPPGSETDHFRLNLADIPFIAGKVVCMHSYKTRSSEK